MLKKKICMLGAYNVGKTSLVRSFVFSIFDDHYHSTVGVKIDKKIVAVENLEIEFLLWDIAGEDERFTVPPSYLRGAAGYLLVMDGTRRSTFEQALDLQKRTEEALGPIPFIAVVNKADLVNDWELGPQDLDALHQRNWSVMKTSAKTGSGVEEVFHWLGRQILARS